MAGGAESLPNVNSEKETRALPRYNGNNSWMFLRVKEKTLSQPFDLESQLVDFAFA